MRIIWGLLLGLVLSVGAYFTLGKAPTPATPRGVSGSNDASAWSWTGELRADGDRWVAHEQVTLSRGSDSLTLHPGTVIRFDPLGLPRLDTGEGELRRDQNLARLTPAGLELLRGSIVDGWLSPVSSFHPTELDPQATSPDLGAQQPPSAEAAGLFYLAQVVDARDRTPLSGVEVRVVFSHYDDGFPPLPTVGVGSDGDGRGALNAQHPTVQRMRTTGDGMLVIAVPWEDDPRLRIIVFADVPGYEPLVHRAVVPREATGVFEFATIELREASTYSWQFVNDSGLPLPGLPLAFEPSSHADHFVGEDLWEKQHDQRADRTLVRYTDNDGLLRLPFDHPVARIAHPTAYNTGPDTFLPSQFVLTDRTYILDPVPGEVRRVRVRQAPASWLKTYQLLDSAGTPIARALIEIRGEKGNVRQYTDDVGGFQYAPIPYRDVSFERPTAVEIVVLSPELYRYRTSAKFPSVESRIVVPGRLGSRLAFRLRVAAEEGGSDGELLPIAADQLEIDHDMTLVRRTADGEVMYEGSLPRAGSFITVRVKGYLPSTVQMPARTPETQLLDLGEIVFERGESLQVQLIGGSAQQYGRARLHIAPAKDAESNQSYRISEDGRVTVSGLTVRETYRISVAGEDTQTFGGDYVLFEKLLAEGLELPAVGLGRQTVQLVGRVPIVDPAQARYYRVVERYFLQGNNDPLTFRSYPLAPSGHLGSIRQLVGAFRAEVFVHGPGGGEAYQVVDARHGLYDFGTLDVRASKIARFRFAVKGLGFVSLPEKLSLVADENSNHEVAGLVRRDSDILELAYLRPGKYSLRWHDGVRPGGYPFVIERDMALLEEVISRPRLPKELVRVRLVDSDGESVAEPQVKVESLEPHREVFPRETLDIPMGDLLPHLPSTPDVSVVTVTLVAGVRNRVEFSAKGLIPVVAELPANVGFEKPVVLPKGARLRGEVRDPEGYPFSGVLEVSWVEPDPEPTQKGKPRFLLGAPFEVVVERGQFDSSLFPPGHRRFTFRDQQSQGKAQVVLELREKQVLEMAPIELRQGRSLRGIVRLPDGSPAVGAIVALTDAANSFRFPQQEDPRLLQQYSTRTDALGNFTIDGLPLQFEEPKTLLAHLDGWTDAVVYPVDLGAIDVVLNLDYAAELYLGIGYPDEQSHPDYEFRMSFYDEIEDRWRDLGPVFVPSDDERLYTGMTPGHYRFSWGLKSPHPDIPSRTTEVAVWPARRANVVIPIREDFVSGVARFRGARLEQGWIVIATDPSDPSTFAGGNIVNGEFLAPVYLSGLQHYAAVIPATDSSGENIPRFDSARGEALLLPVRIRRNEVLSLDYEAYDFVLRFPEDVLAGSPALEVEFPHYEFVNGSYRTTVEREKITGDSFRLTLLRPGELSVRVIGRGWSRGNNFDLDEDVNILFQR